MKKTARENAILTIQKLKIFISNWFKSDLETKI